MKVLVLGSGGREHTLVWKIAQSSKVEKIYCAPGNGGIEQIAEIPNFDANNNDDVLSFVKENNIDLTVVGPEAYLVNGIVDVLEDAGYKAFGPRKAATELEASKIFTKEFLKKYGINSKIKMFKNCEHRIPVEGSSHGLAFLKKNLL